MIHQPGYTLESLQLSHSSGDHAETIQPQSTSSSSSSKSSVFTIIGEEPPETYFLRNVISKGLHNNLFGRYHHIKHVMMRNLGLTLYCCWCVRSLRVIHVLHGNLMYILLRYSDQWLQANIIRLCSYQATTTRYPP